jgi:hypothetical protein
MDYRESILLGLPSCRPGAAGVRTGQQRNGYRPNIISIDIKGARSFRTNC